jgi:hypothetical protein
MANPSRARLFYDEVLSQKGNAFAFLQALIGQPDAAENAWRDYKGAGFFGRDPKPGADKEKVKKVWSENLSAFANTGGGVLIWGFQTKDKIPDKLDLAQDCHSFADMLKTLVNDATDPYVAGVEVTAISQNAGAPEGIVLCYIPESGFGPHQALWGERTYWIRTQDSNLICPQPLLRNMFYPRLQARLEPVVKLTVSTDRGGFGLFFEIRIRNVGPATADVAIVQVVPHAFQSQSPSCGGAWQHVDTGLFQSRYPLPPGYTSPHCITASGILLNQDPVLKFRFFTHNTPAHHAEVSFPSNEIIDTHRTKLPIEREARSHPV